MNILTLRSTSLEVVMYNQSYLIKQIHIIILLIAESKKTSNICVLLFFFFSFSFKEKAEYYKEEYSTRLLDTIVHSSNSYNDSDWRARKLVFSFARSIDGSEIPATMSVKCRKCKPKEKMNNRKGRETVV